MSNATHDARPAKRAGEFHRLEPVREELKPVSDVRAIERAGTLRVYLNVMPVLEREKPRRVKLAAVS